MLEFKHGKYVNFFLIWINMTSSLANKCELINRNETRIGFEKNCISMIQFFLLAYNSKRRASLFTISFRFENQCNSSTPISIPIFY